MNTLSISDPKISQAISCHVKSIDAKLAKIDTIDDAQKLLAATKAMSNYARQVKVDNSYINELVYAKTKICALIGKLSPAKLPSEYGKQGGRGNKGGKSGLHPLSRPTIALYRKLDKGNGHIREYHDLLNAINEELDTAMEASTKEAATFILKGKEKMEVILRRKAGQVAKQGNAPRKKVYTGNYEWYTPSVYVEAARNVLQAIDLDPASCKLANKTVKAKRFYSESNCALDKPWKGRIFLNPPYGRGIIGDFCEKLLSEIHCGNVTHAVVIVNSCTDTKWWQGIAEVSSLLCFPLGRVKFETPNNDNTSATLDPTTIFYYGSRKKQFSENFSQFGLIFPPM